jgi:hypothetical protein
MADWLRAVEPLKDKSHVWITFEEAGEQRSLGQNALWFGRVVPVVMEFFNRDRVVPLNKEQVHTVLITAFVGQEETPLGPVAVSSRTLSKDQFSTLIEKVMAHFSQPPYALSFPAEGDLIG